jgi:hypothetical protein
MPLPPLQPFPASARRDLRNGRNVELDGGIFAVDRTLTASQTNGHAFAGAGNLPCDPRVNRHRGGTALVWTGAAGQPMFALDGVACLNMEGLTLIGRPDPAAPARCGPLVLVTTPAGWGSQFLTFSRLTLIDADAGVRFGQPGQPNNSDSALRDCNFIGLGTGFHTVCDQAVNFELASPRFLGCGTAIDAEAGGCVHVGGAGAIQACGWAVRLGRPGAETSGGDNVFTSSLRGVRVEGDFRVAAGPWRRLILDGCQMCSPWGQFVTDVDRTSELCVRGCRFAAPQPPPAP